MSEQPSMRVTPFVLDRTINIPFLLTVAAAVLAASAWTSAVNHRLDRLEERTRGLPDIEVRLARMDERGEASKATLARIEQRLNDVEDGR